MSVDDLHGAGAKVRPLAEGHIDRIVELMNKEGWYYYDRRELLRYIELNQDCFALVQNGNAIGSLFTTNYGSQAWIGNIIVDEEHRGEGHAVEMLKVAIDHLYRTRRIATFRLGSVPLAIGLYRKFGFRAEAFTTAQEAPLPIVEDGFEETDLDETVSVERFAADDLEEAAEIDQRYIKSSRAPLLASLYRDSIEGSCYCLRDRGRLVGFLMIRRRLASKTEGRFAEGPDYAYRLGPSCILPEYGINGFKALFQEAIHGVNDEVRKLGGLATLYVVFPRNADRNSIYGDTRELAAGMGLDTGMDLDAVFDQHGAIFGSAPSQKNDAQWRYMEKMGFHQEYFEQVMSYTHGETPRAEPEGKTAEDTQADPEGIYACATPGDKA